MQALIFAFMTVIASFVAAVSGFGLSTVLIPTFSFFLPLSEVILLVGIIHLFNSILKALLFHSGFDWRLLLYFGLPSIIFSYIGASFVTQKIDTQLTQLFGLFFIGYTILLFAVPDFKIKKTKQTLFLGGSVYGFSTGFFGIGGAIKSIFLSAFDLHKVVYIATTGILALFVDVTRLLTYWQKGLQLPNHLWWSLLLILPATVLGTWLARCCVHKIPQDKFRFLVGAFLFLIGLKFVFFSVV